MKQNRYRTTPSSTISVTVWFIFMYILLLSVSVLLHSVLTPVLIRSVKVCVSRNLYTTRARMHKFPRQHDDGQ